MHKRHLRSGHTGRGRSILVVVVKGSGLGYRFIGEEVLVLGMRLKRIMGRFVRTNQEKRAIHFSLRQPAYCLT